MVNHFPWLFAIPSSLSRLRFGVATGEEEVWHLPSSMERWSERKKRRNHGDMGVAPILGNHQIGIEWLVGVSFMENKKA